MFGLSAAVRVDLAKQPADMGKSFDGLAALASGSLALRTPAEFRRRRQIALHSLRNHLDQPRPSNPRSQRRSFFRQCRTPLPPGHHPCRSDPVDRRLPTPPRTHPVQWTSDRRRPRIRPPNSPPSHRCLGGTSMFGLNAEVCVDLAKQPAHMRKSFDGPARPGICQPGASDSRRVPPPSPNLASLLPKASRPDPPVQSRPQRRSCLRQCRPPHPPGHHPCRSDPVDHGLPTAPRTHPVQWTSDRRLGGTPCLD
jgi:hypothetical protein